MSAGAEPISDRPAASPRRVLVSGSTGLIGRRLVAALRAAGDTVVPLARGGHAPGAVSWDPEGGRLEPAAVSGFDAVVHLAGEPIATGHWTTEKKRRIYDSRVHGTATLSRALAAAPQPPSVVVSASAIGFYGENGNRPVDETSPRGAGFLADACAAWEAATQPLAGVCRVVHLRIGVVLARHGGALAAMLPAFRFGLGGPIAGGRAYVSWITLDDLLRVIHTTLEDRDLTGPVNAVAPEPVTNLALTRALAQTLHRPARVPVPGWVLRLTLGEMATETVLTSIRVTPHRLVEQGFRFQYPEIQQALAHVLAG